MERLEKVVANIQEGKAAPIYFLYGEDRFTLDEWVSEISQAILQGIPVDFNFDRFSGEDCKAESLEIVLNTLPMMAERRLVTVKYADKLSPAAKEVIRKYVSDPIDSTCLLITADKVGALSKGMSRSTIKVQFKTPYENQLPAWVQQRARKHRLRIDVRGVRLLVDCIGRDLASLDSALEKLSLYVGQNNSIGVHEVEELIARTGEHSIFEFCDAVGSRDLKVIWPMLLDLVENMEPLRILAMIARHLRILLKLKVMDKAGSNEAEMAKAISIHPFLLRSKLSQIRRFSSGELQKALYRMSQTDLAIKSSSVPSRFFLEEMVLDICRKA